MKWTFMVVICGMVWPAAGLAQPAGECALGCSVTFPGRLGAGYEACMALACPSDGLSGPAWEFGRMEDPEHGGFAAISSDDLSQQLILTCESRGPISVVLRSATIDRGEAQWIVDGQSVEWLDMEQRNGVLVAEVPRASRLVMALQDGGRVSVLSRDGRAQVDFGLRGSDRAITAAMDYCMER
ncbi:hypothetical protein [Flavimaricola marinus]|uniref:Invasion associated locus B (IalB) protein n=1 Tax=Flavimaricola marinus TaxID=1819565 RepID=A0A238LD58_9RHOB|nr:hypothetical protein [Flavimaricola marinus]SMY07355.1 hypothetical protein LOM8899_01490 [Flavimaricola marinus]